MSGPLLFALGLLTGLLLAFAAARLLARRRVRRAMDALADPALLLRGSAITAGNAALRALLGDAPPPRQLQSLFAPADGETVRRLLERPDAAGREAKLAVLLTLPQGRLPVTLQAGPPRGGLRLLRIADQRPALRQRELETLGAWMQERAALAVDGAELQRLLAGLLDNFGVEAALLVYRPLAAAGMRQVVALPTLARSAEALATLEAAVAALPSAVTSDAAAPGSVGMTGLDLVLIESSRWPPPAALLLPAGTLAAKAELRQALERLKPALAGRISLLELSVRLETSELALIGLVEAVPPGVVVLTGTADRRRLRHLNPRLVHLLAAAGEPLTFARFRAAHLRSFAASPARDALLGLLDGGATPGPFTLAFADGEGRLVVHHRRVGPAGAEGLDLLIYEDRRSAEEAEGLLVEKYGQLEALHREQLAAHQELSRQAADLKAAHQQMNAKHQELQSLYRDLQGTAEFKSTLLGTMTHELKSPLVSIGGYLELLKRGQGGPLAEAQLRLLDVALRNLHNLNGIISRLIEYSQLEREGILINPRPFALGEWAAGVVARHGAQAEAAGVALEFRPPAPELELTADAHLLETLLSNLLDNAVKFSPAGSRVAVSAQAEGGDKVALVVSDTGCGIPRDLHQRVFDGFFQVDRTLARAAAGLGIGLAMVRRIAALHGGEVALDSAPGQGSRFTVTLPKELPGKEG